MMMARPILAVVSMAMLLGSAPARGASTPSVTPVASTPAYAELAAAKAEMMTEPGRAFAHARAAFRIAAGAPADHARDLALASADWLSAEALTRLDHPDQALAILERTSTSVGRIAPGSKLQGDIFSSSGRAERALGQVQKALADDQAAFTIYQHADLQRNEAISLQEIGSIYLDARDYPHVLQYYAQSSDVYKQDPALDLSAHNNRGFALKDMGRLSDAESEFRLALEAARAMKSTRLQAEVLTNLAQSEALDGKLARARADAEHGLALAAADPEARSEQPFLMGVLAKITLEQGAPGKAAALLDRVFSGVDVLHTSPQYRDIHEIAAQVYERTGDRGKALDHLKAFKRLDDAGRTLASSTSAALMGARFDFANQATKIAQLKAARLRQNVALAEARARFSTIVTVILLVAGAFVTALISHAFFSMRRSRDSIRAVNAELATTNGALEKALKAKTEFLATTSHEIRTPLNGILGMTQVMLADHAVLGETRERLALVKAAGDTMSALVNDLLDVAKIETGNLSVSRAEVDLRRLLEDATRMWADKARLKGLSFESELSPCPHRVVEDGDRLRQVLFNLLSNAIKFTEQGGVTFSVEVTGDAACETIRFCVTDTGIGIPPEHHESIFESFVQVDGGMSRQRGGTGLGLTICRNLANALEGRITLASTVGAGSTFVLELPLRRAGGVAATVAPDAVDPGAQFLVVVETNPLAQSMLRTILSPHVRRLEFVKSLDDVAACVAGGCDQILIDGAHVARSRPAADPVAVVGDFVRDSGAPVCALWPNPTPEEVARLEGAGVRRVIPKPVAAATLLEALSLEPASARNDDRKVLANVA